MRPVTPTVGVRSKLRRSGVSTVRPVAALAGELGGPVAEAAGHLCKADLTTEMVKEFTDLQGLVGALYARAQGVARPVAQAMYEHYKPLSMEDSIPSTAAGQALSVADKVDTLRSCFSVGMIPSGSKDPFALRRAAQGVVKILAEGSLTATLDDLCAGDEVVEIPLRLSAEESPSVPVLPPEPTPNPLQMTTQPPPGFRPKVCPARSSKPTVGDPVNLQHRHG